MTPPAKKGRYNLMKLENLAPRLAAEQLSNGTAARFLSKYNEVVGIQEQVTEKKIRNIRAKSRGALLDNLKGTAVEALYFDGRKDRGTLLKDSDEVLRRQEEEHITLVEQPSGRYLGFATPDSGSGVDTVRAIGEHCKELGIDISGLKCCGCDGTSTNTGRHSGVVVLLEKKLGRELQRSVCSLHRIELPFRHFFTSLDGVTTGPNSFSGPIGKLAAGPVHQMASRKFVPLRAHTFSPLPDGVVKKLSWDQKVLYRHVLAVQTGALPPKLAGTEIGPLCHARWITFQSRILRLFMSGGVPGNVMGKLRKLAEFWLLPLCMKIVIVKMFGHLFLDALFNEFREERISEVFDMDIEVSSNDQSTWKHTLNMFKGFMGLCRAFIEAKIFLKGNSDTTSSTSSRLVNNIIA
ncbi:uncharacterized protein LOC134818736 [Bolinopsis microptera]|uniref:uncharacterized protein LOC134818736 n=1 Tax=Bolinopsis microptera TaxID=2820187 RepID=UPI00307A2220